MIQRPLDLIEEADLASLVSNKVAERRDLEFKRELPAGADAAVKEFLADVSSLANAQGGDLVYGVAEKDGAAAAVMGLDLADPDAELLRLEERIRDGLDPRLTGLKLRSIPLASGRHVIFIRAPASLAAPHRVRFKNSSRFYSRNSRGKYEMDTHELRQAFTASEQLPARMRALHARAVEAASGVDMPFSMSPEPRAVISIVPLGLFRELRDLPVTRENALAPIRGGGFSWMHMLEGMMLHTQINDGFVRSYALTHRQGRTDAAWIVGRVVERDEGQQYLVWPKHFEAGLLEAARDTMAKLRALGAEGPWVVFATVSNIRGFQLVLGEYDLSEPAWRTGASLPEVIADQLDEGALLPMAKAFWLLFGEARPEGRALG